MKYRFIPPIVYESYPDFDNYSIQKQNALKRKVLSDNQRNNTSSRKYCTVKRLMSEQDKPNVFLRKERSLVSKAKKGDGCDCCNSINGLSLYTFDGTTSNRNINNLIVLCNKCDVPSTELNDKILFYK